MYYFRVRVIVIWCGQLYEISPRSTTMLLIKRNLHLGARHSGTVGINLSVWLVHRQCCFIFV